MNYSKTKNRIYTPITDITWYKCHIPNEQGQYKYKAFCDCGKEISSRHSDLKVHTGYCRSCSNKKENKERVALLKRRLLEEKKRSILKSMKKKKKIIKERSLGEKIIEFDNSDGTVRSFNRIFNEVQGGNQDDIIDIGLPYTYRGREMVRYYQDGTERAYRFLFNDELEIVQGSRGDLVIDIFHKEKGHFLHTYRHTSTLARDLDVSQSCIRDWLENDKNAPVKIKVRNV